ncbi:MAG TPA: HigA family addiction module antitoxin [Allosphingosinicella sp.]|nr:HigA family addiction module antitoxin [Allosphingosinicella sp.]
MTDQIIHPGQYVREHVIPNGMNVTKAAKLLDVSRPTLSNFLNGKAELSSEMAARLEAAFGARARTLLDVQSAWDAAKTKRGNFAPVIKSYVPPFLQIKARHIEDWGTAGIKPRQRLSVFLRTLLNSTGVDLTKVDFPGNDDSERAGWDGEVIAGRATPWIPEGHSGWEFGVTEDVKGKADGDFAKSTSAIPDPQRKEMTFVFVTPRSWAGKAAWVKTHQAKKLWKDVRAYDSSDLEQWLEQSLAGQAWFANETGQEAQGAISLDEAAKIWGADCSPQLAPALFADAISTYRSTLKRTLAADTYQPVIIAADSKDEALGFLSTAFASDDPDLRAYRDRIIIFRETGALTKLASQVTNFIPVILSREVEKEFAPFRLAMPSFIVYPRNATTSDPDITLETLNWETFNKVLEAMGLEKDRIDQLSRESGRSLTVLRRRLSQLPAIRTPDWASDHAMASHLIPFVFAGAWKAENKTDRAMLEILAGDVAFDELERRLAALLPLDSTPVWSTGAFRGVVSKIDVLFAIQNTITAADLQRFFDVASLVLAEEDPALELPEKDQWAAGIYGKTREISGALREGLAETLVLLSVYGPTLFKTRLSFDAAAHSNRLVKELLTPLTKKTLESQIDNLPLYSEAAPETFLSIIEADLKGNASVAMDLMRPASDLPFGSSPRTGLLWALENLAWSNELFLRTVLVLGRLAERAIDDNLVNKPAGSLSSIFRAWMPQTSATLEHRKAALKKLAEKHPEVAWPIAVEQFSVHSGIGHYSHKPRWRPDGHGLGNPITAGERNDFALFAFRLALTWPAHTLRTISDLVSNLGGIDEKLHKDVWNAVDTWIGTASEDDKAALRERIRTSTFTRRAIKQRSGAQAERSVRRAKQIYDRLAPADPILRHGWLFRQAWVDESADELAQEGFDFRKRDARIAELRTQAVREVFSAGGVQSVLELAERGQAAHNVGWFLATVVSDKKQLAAVLIEVAKRGELSETCAAILSGALLKAGEEDDSVLRLVAAAMPAEKVSALLTLAPFGKETWALVDELGDNVAGCYWNDVTPRWNRDNDDLLTAVRRLMTARRPRAAFEFAHMDLKGLPPRQLYELLVAVLTNSGEPPKTYLLDQYHLREAFKLLNASGQMTTDEMAGLEFQFIDIFTHGDDVKPANLARSMAKQPELFVQAVAFIFKRDDGGIDPPELRLDDDELRANRASHSYKLLEAIELLPGQENGALDAGRLVAWIEQARTSFKALARQDIGDQMIGKILSKAPPAEDGVWPCLPVRNALEEVITDHIEQGLHVALRNARGVHWRGEGGSQEREIAAKYRAWADAMEYTHPKVAAIHRRLEKSYLREAEWEDNDAKIARRMRH